MSHLVTGANGFLGAALVERLVARGAEGVVALVRAGSDLSRLTELRERVGDAFEIRTFSLKTADAAFEAIEDARVIHHLAASLKGSPADMILNTVVTTRNLLDAVARCSSPPKVVLVSSFSVYGTAQMKRGAVLDEDAPLETEPNRRDPYAQAKLRQEQLCWERAESDGFALAVVRPGVIYGPSGGAMSGRVGLQLPGLFLHLGGNNLLPLSYVHNCAEAIAVVGASEAANGRAFNAHDDDLPTARAYLRRYAREVQDLRRISIPYPLTLLGSRIWEGYHHYSRGQLPAIFTPYKTATAWKGTRFDNRRIKSLGWRQLVPTDEGLRRTFAHLRASRAVP